ncbi:YihY/virulence factor BrkB family protein [Sphingomonas colocasiae]|uniref:YihY/virulence factor BrkB family protein n=1 Tax=Sphingomonas colocasiae TaxID=1848973 RepID=A0ABS7PNE7_9SPHN|nr:YihY/virulence factor BrkB family protein [Sphingomonas colocasiae]MBY8822514.1 YihY/virulence factor BrkB family protein [Sphingomonas colocasiae]
MQNISPQSPEERRKRLSGARAAMQGGLDRIRPGTYPFTVAKRVAIGVYSDGFIHAGNLAYLALVTLFPFFIVAAAVARLFGRTEDGLHAVDAFLRTVPPGVAEVLAKPIGDVLGARSGSLLWLGALVGLWTTGSFIETIRDILRRAYGVRYSRPFWEYRLGSIGLIVGSVILVMIAFSFQVILLAAEQFIIRVLPVESELANLVTFSRAAPGLALFAAMYMLFVSLTPKAYRGREYPKWPGALIVTAWWLGVSALLPMAIAHFGSYDLTYGSLAGVMISLIFFYLVGFGVVIGAELNAALAESPGTRRGDDSPAPVAKAASSTVTEDV